MRQFDARIELYKWPVEKFGVIDETVCFSALLFP